MSTNLALGGGTLHKHCLEEPLVGQECPTHTTTRSAPVHSLAIPPPVPASADRAIHRQWKPGAHTTPCSAERNSFRRGIRGGCRRPCIAQVELPDSRAAASSNAPSRPRRYTNNVRLPGTATGSVVLTQYCP